MNSIREIDFDNYDVMAIVNGKKVPVVGYDKSTDMITYGFYCGFIEADAVEKIESIKLKLINNRTIPSFNDSYIVEDVIKVNETIDNATADACNFYLWISKIINVQEGTHIAAVYSSNDRYNVRCFIACASEEDKKFVESAIRVTKRRISKERVIHE